MNIIKELIENEPKSAYDIKNSLNLDYGNTNRNTKKLLEMGYIIEAGREKGKTNNEKILYDATEIGIIRYLQQYIAEDDIYSKNQEKTLSNCHKQISKIFLKYSQQFPVISNNMNILLDFRYSQDIGPHLDIFLYSLNNACKSFLKEASEIYRNKKLMTGNPDIIIYDYDIELIFKKPDNSLIEIFQEEFISSYILEPSNSYYKIIPNARIFFDRMDELINESEELENLIFNYLQKKKFSMKEIQIIIEN